MKSINKNYLFLLGIIFALEIQAQDYPNQLVAEFGPTWERAKAYTLEVAQAMPESAYSYRPSEEVLTFGEHLLHIVDNYYYLNTKFVLQTEDYPYDFAEADTLNKAQILGRLQAAFDYVTVTMASLSDAQLADTIEFWSPSPTLRKSVFYLMRDHMTHHRGMMVIYLRMQGIKPPQYRGW